MLKLFKDGHSIQAYEALGLSKALDEEVFLLPRWIVGPMLDVNFPLLNRRGPDMVTDRLDNSQ